MDESTHLYTFLQTVQAHVHGPKDFYSLIEYAAAQVAAHVCKAVDESRAPVLRGELSNYLMILQLYAIVKAEHPLMVDSKRLLRIMKRRARDVVGTEVCDLRKVAGRKR